jgi:hypothetical protein
MKSDPWCVAVNDFLEDGTYPNDFVGHCCELTEEWRREEKKTAPPQETRYDGHLYLPEFSLMIDSPFDCVDVHGFGGNKMVSPVVHCVVSHSAAEVFFAANVVLTELKNDNEQVKFVEVDSPYSANLKLKVRCRD